MFLNTHSFGSQLSAGLLAFAITAASILFAAAPIHLG